MERRFFALAGNPIQIDKRVGTDPPYIVGYAAPFYRAENPGSEYQIDGKLYVERIMRTAFDRALRECDVRCLFNHDPSYILGRNIAGTLELSVDDIGLRYRARLPDTSFAQDVVQSVTRGDITGSSFAFMPFPDGVVMIHEKELGLWVRELHSVELFDVSPVTFPAYEATTAQARARGDQSAALADLEQFRSSLALAQKLKGYDQRAAEVADYLRLTS
jgi:HK97 family phage prohead protease